MPQTGHSLAPHRCRDCGKVKHCLADELIGQPSITPFPIQNTILPKGRYIYH